MRTDNLTLVFVEFIPKTIEAGVFYISMEYETCRHLCPCGCGEHVPIPFCEGEWTLTNNSGQVSLHPSLLQRFECCSHYWIKNNKIIWC